MTIRSFRPADISEVAKKIQARWESDLPDLVLESLRQFEGKKLTKRYLSKLGPGTMFIREVARMTHLENEAYQKGDFDNGVSLLISYGAPVIDCNWIKAHNPAYFEARKDRNAKRLEALNDPRLLQNMANALFEYQQAKECFAIAQKELATMVDYGEAFSPDGSLWRNIGEGKETL
jgi:hypothetical protein